MHRPEDELVVIKKPRRDNEALNRYPVDEIRHPFSRRDAVLIRQHREKMRRKRIVRKREYQRLRTMVPSIATKPLVSKVTVIEEAIRYIDYLHGALLARLKTKGLPHCLQGLDVDITQLGHDDIKDLVSQMVAATNSTSPQQTTTQQQQSTASSSRRDTTSNSSGLPLERMRQVPSYLTVKRQHRKRS